MKSNNSENSFNFEDNFNKKSFLKNLIDDENIGNYIEEIETLRKEVRTIQIQEEKRELRVFKINEIGYSSEFPTIEKLENVISSLKNTLGDYIYILIGNNEKVSIYLGISILEKEKFYSTADICYEYLEKIFLSNFEGSKLTEKGDEITLENEIENHINNMNNIAVLKGIPTVCLDENNENKKGLDSVLKAMQGEDFTVIIRFSRVEEKEFFTFNEEVNKNFNLLYQEYSEKKIISIQKNNSNSESKNKTSKKDKYSQESENKEKSNGGQYSRESSNHTSSRSKMCSIDKNISNSRNNSESITETKEYINKKNIKYMEYFEKIFLQRLDEMKTRGCYKTSMILLTKRALELDLLESSYLNIIQSNTPNIYPCSFSSLKLDDDNKKEILRNIAKFKQIYYKNDTNKEKKINLRLLLSEIQVENNTFLLGNYMTSMETACLINLVKQEVPGLTLKQSIEFGQNTPRIKERKNILELGKIINNGMLTKNNVNIDIKQLDKHIFIAGVTGSGKTTTCQKILLDTDLPFLVIEPAKREYRKLAKIISPDDMYIYTLGNENCSNFRLNPFEFFEDELLTSHIDMLKASFISAFSMEAAMPQLIETAIYRCYENYGWDIDTGENIYLKDRKKAWSCMGKYFPILEDLLIVIDEVIKEKNMGERLEGEYRGSIIARIESLLIGSKGQMLNTRVSYNFMELIDKKVVFELEDLKDISDKTFMMALILSRLGETLKSKYKSAKKGSIRHLTLIEEAHRLLTNVSLGESENRKHGVEMFADMLAEIRKYEEGLIVVDQIPNKLSNEVLKNTNTKIIHKIFAKDDKEVVGNMINLNEKQKQYLSNLRTGEAIVFSQGWDKSVHIKVDMINKISELEEMLKVSEDYSNEEIIELMKNKNINMNYSFFKEYYNEIPEIQEKEYKKKLKRFILSLKRGKGELADIIENLKNNKNFRNFFISNFIERLYYDYIIQNNNEKIKNIIDQCNKKLSGKGLPDGNDYEKYNFFVEGININ